MKLIFKNLHLPEQTVLLRSPAWR